MKSRKKKLMALAASVMTAAMVFSTGISAQAAGDQSSYGKVPVAVTPGGVFVYGCYYDDFVRYPVYTVDFPVEYLMAIDAAGITNEMSDYEKCVRVNDYLCRAFEYGVTEMPSPHKIVGADGVLTIIGDNNAGGLGTDLFQYGKGVCSGYADAFQTMTSMLGIKSYTYGSWELNHGWNAVDIDGVRYFVDVTWNDNENYPNRYLMSTELWADHTAADIGIKGASLYGWEIRQAEEQAEIEQGKQWEKQKNDLMWRISLSEWNGQGSFELFADELSELGLTVTVDEYGVEHWEASNGRGWTRTTLWRTRQMNIGK